jgi:putative FmdB family regulatory protein
MPTYEYRCPDGHEFERFYRKISDATPDVTCPVCGKPAERKLSAGAGLVFKGSGFYLTDYGKNAHRGGSAPSGSGEGQGGEGKSSSEPKADSGSAPSESKAEKSESKPAAESTKPAEKPAPKPAAPKAPKTGD